MSRPRFFETVAEQELRVGLGDLLGATRRRRRRPLPSRAPCRRRARLRERDRDAARRDEDCELHRGELFHKSRKVSYIPRMAVDPELLEILACPNCKTPVTLVKNGTALKCAHVQARLSDQGRHPGDADRRSDDRGIEHLVIG